MDAAFLFDGAREASRNLLKISDEKRNEILLSLSGEILGRTPALLDANRRDLERMDPSNPKYDRLKLTPERLQGIAEAMRQVAALPSPLGTARYRFVRPDGLLIRKVSVPFGVIGVIYEARPNVTFDVFGLCFKSGSACILKGGHDADCSSREAVRLIKDVLAAGGVDPRCVTLLEPTHEAAGQLLHAAGKVDLIIPRGSAGLIRFVRENATVPVIETGAGICHTYFDKSGDLEKGTRIVCNAKTRRVSVCNALDCLIVHRDRLGDLAALCAPLAEHKVLLFADGEAFRALDGRYPFLQQAQEKDFGTEFLDYKMAVRTVGSAAEAVAHITRHGSGHSESIVTEDAAVAADFQRDVDAACVYVNAPTSFSDGGEFGLGAEIGISTQKMHARGPMGLEEITTYKWLVEGNGQIRQA